MAVRERIVLHGAAAAATLLIWAPLGAPGYLLSYDMVFVPQQSLRWDLVAPSDSLPRAVPQDAVVSLLSVIAPGWLLQRLALVAIVYLAVLGAARLVPAQRPLTRLIAGVGYAWTPFLAERLLLGQWGLLLAYAALPWLVRAARGVRGEQSGALPRLVLAAAICAITPTGGLIALAVTTALTVDRAAMRRAAVAVGAATLVNLPWLLAAALSSAGGRSDPDGVEAFAVRAENWSGVLGAVAGTGGIWNAQTTPASRASLLVPVVTLAVVALAVAGYPQLRRRWPSGDAARMGAVALGGLFVALAGALPGTGAILRWLVEYIPGTGLFRDGHKFLIPYALLLSLCLALGAERIASRLAVPRARAVLVAIVVLPLATMPDLVFGAGGKIRPVTYPDDWKAVTELIAADPGEVVSLPPSLYRRYEWNRGRPVIDPAPRYLPVDVLVDDTLLVGPIDVAGESPRAEHMRQIIRAGRPITSTGVRWALIQHDSRQVVSERLLDGMSLIYEGEFLSLYRNADAAPADDRPGRGRFVILIAYLAIAVSLGVSIWHLPRTTTAW